MQWLQQITYFNIKFGRGSSISSKTSSSVKFNLNRDSVYPGTRTALLLRLLKLDYGPLLGSPPYAIKVKSSCIEFMNYLDMRPRGTALDVPEITVEVELLKCGKIVDVYSPSADIFSCEIMMYY